MRELICFLLAGINVAFAMSPVGDPSYTWMNWGAAVYIFGIGLAISKG